MSCLKVSAIRRFLGAQSRGDCMSGVFGVDPGHDRKVRRRALGARTSC
jgi:hypothetical protein